MAGLTPFFAKDRVNSWPWPVQGSSSDMLLPPAITGNHSYPPDAICDLLKVTAWRVQISYTDPSDSSLDIAIDETISAGTRLVIDDVAETSVVTDDPWANLMEAAEANSPSLGASEIMQFSYTDTRDATGVSWEGSDNNPCPQGDEWEWVSEFPIPEGESCDDEAFRATGDGLTYCNLVTEDTWEAESEFSAEFDIVFAVLMPIVTHEDGVECWKVPILFRAAITDGGSECANVYSSAGEVDFMGDTVATVHEGYHPSRWTAEVSVDETF